MFRFVKVRAIAASGLVVVGALYAMTGTGANWAVGAGKSAPARVAAAVASQSQPECRRPDSAIDREIQALRQSCELELEAFAACRASRSTWDTVELFGCGFEMSTSLATGDVEDPASLEDCGAAAPRGEALDGRAQRGDGQLRHKECPVPACEAELEELNAVKADAAPSVC